MSGRLGPRFRVRFWTPKRAPFVGKIFAAGRKIVQVSIVSAGTRQKFRIPLCHWVPMVLQRREQLFSTPCERLCPHMFLNCSRNMCGHKCSQGVENKCLRRCKTMEKQRHGNLLSRTCRNNRNSCYFSPVTKILPTKRPPFWGPETDPKMEATHSVSI